MKTMNPNVFERDGYDEMVGDLIECLNGTGDISNLIFR